MRLFSAWLDFWPESSIPVQGTDATTVSFEVVEIRLFMRSVQFGCLKCLDRHIENDHDNEIYGATDPIGSISPGIEKQTRQAQGYGRC